MKGTSEAQVRDALKAMDLEGLIVYKPPDDARNWKPADFLVWWLRIRDLGPLRDPGSGWVEVKETQNIGTFPLADLRPSQKQAIRMAKEAGLPYLLVIRWRARKLGAGTWSIVDAVRLLDWVEEVTARTLISVERTLLESRFGTNADPGQLASLLRLALTEGL